MVFFLFVRVVSGVVMFVLWWWMEILSIVLFIVWLLVLVLWSFIICMGC